MTAKITVPFAVMLALLTCLSGCDRKQRQLQLAAQQTAVAESAARQNASAFDDAVAQGNWILARAQADVLMAGYPGTEAAKRVRGQYDSIKDKAEAAREQARLLSLWSYNRKPVKGGDQLSASIYAREPVDVDGSGAKPVRLIFRDHPAWGMSSYLVLEAGDFDCHGGCKVAVAAGDAAPRSMAASRPKTDEAIAMFIEDERGLWKLARNSRTIRIEFPVKAGGKRSAEFEVGGLDGNQMPGWD